MMSIIQHLNDEYKINMFGFGITNRMWRGLGLILMTLLSACINVSSLPTQAVSRFALPPPGSDAIGSLVAIRLRAQDALREVARYFDIGHDEILDANPNVDPQSPGEGTRILIPTQHLLPPGPRQGIVINLAALRLYYYLEDGQTVISYPTGIGRDSWATPEGNTRVIAKEIEPSWRVPPSIRTEYARMGNSLPTVVAPGADNPLGRYALRLNLPGYLIHGTNRPYGVGMRVSHGCVQLYPEDISDLFSNVPVGMRVTIVNRPYVVGRIAGRWYLETHPFLSDDLSEQRSKAMAQVRQALLDAGADLAEIDWNRVAKAAQVTWGVPLPIYRGAPAAESVLAAVPLVKTGVIAGTWSDK
ncbi:L,D-transpeptidase ErfK/SrfK [Gammaproteobacteria bacterium]